MHQGKEGKSYWPVFKVLLVILVLFIMVNIFR